MRAVMNFLLCVCFVYRLLSSHLLRSCRRSSWHPAFIGVAQVRSHRLITREGVGERILKVSFTRALFCFSPSHRELWNFTGLGTHYLISVIVTSRIECTCLMHAHSIWIWHIGSMRGGWMNVTTLTWTLQRQLQERPAGYVTNWHPKYRFGPLNWIRDQLMFTTGFNLKMRSYEMLIEWIWDVEITDVAYLVLPPFLFSFFSGATCSKYWLSRCSTIAMIILKY